ncbi:MAG TPA: cysteine synthase A [Treponemataceae bacterium]|jgi:cysteine synthase A|nr:cysteine synthase A [Treponemataceae bacterium]HOQ92904.1 cysteine synthase A [Treponemataceae bacterium]HPY52810.1 cysteine synthase A [Treponemataceae bacterium]HQC26766.1 cysteine synthase A [Treponemataceae bacterium]HUH43888.1 cysteine synthase A [Treponemataceae bacterium]
MNVAKNILALVGKTPLVSLSRWEKEKQLNAQIIAKLESYNPAGSVKDRIAKAMIEDAFEKKRIDKNSVIIEPTSGNTGIGLAFVAAQYGLKIILTMPETMSIERRALLKAYGAEIVLTEGSKGMKGAIQRAEELAQEIPNAYIPGQFENPVNPLIHYETTGAEIWEDSDGKVDILVSGVGTGGTLTGAGRYLKEKNPAIQVVAVEPSASPVLSGGEPGAHKIQGLGAGFIPKTLDTEIYDSIIQVDNDDAFETGRELGRVEGLLCGISSGAALYAASRLAEDPKNAGKNIVVIFPDTGERYLSTPLFTS